MKPILLASVLLTGTVAVSTAGLAAGTFGLKHPRLHEINERLRMQNARIDRREAEGKISTQEAAMLHADDASIKAEESTEKALDKGHLTKADQRALNQQLNTVSRDIGGVRHLRIHEVNTRLRVQTARIDRDETAGKITEAEAASFHSSDAALKAEEATERSLDDGHITRAEERSLNEQISSIGHAISSAAGTSGSGAGSHSSRGGSHR